MKIIDRISSFFLNPEVIKSKTFENNVIPERVLQAMHISKIMKSVQLQQALKPNSGLRARHLRGLTGYNIGYITAKIPRAYLTSEINSPDPWWSKHEVEKADVEANQEQLTDEQNKTIKTLKETQTKIKLLDGSEVTEIRKIKYDYKTKRRFKEIFVEKEDGSHLNYNRVPKNLFPLLGVDSLEINDDSEIILTEGWFPAEALQRRGKNAVGSMTGAFVAPSERALIPILKAKTIYLWPDNDSAGVHHMQLTAKRLNAMGAKDIRIIRWIKGPRKADAADFIGSDDELDALLKKATKWSKDQAISNGGILRVRPPNVPLRLAISSGSRPPIPTIQITYPNSQEILKEDSISRINTNIEIEGD